MTRVFLLIIFILFVVPIITTADTVVISDGDLIRAQGDVDVFIVKIIYSTSSIQVKKFKRLVLNPEIFNKYEHLYWENIKEVNQETLNQYTTSELVRAVDDKKVYKLYPSGDVGEKRWIKTTDDFLDLGYDWDAIYNINSFERDFYVPGDDLVAETLPVPPSDGGKQPEEEEPSRDPITINVPGDYLTIQGAIDAAINGDTISVGSGTYKENIVVNKNIKLIGNYAVSAVVNGQGKGPAISVEGADDFLIQRFTIISTNNKGVYCSGESLSKGTIKNTIIKDSGSGIYIDGKCDLSILNNLIFDNKDSLKEGGFGIYIKNDELYDFTVEIINNSIDNNYHGIWAENVNLKLMNNIITNSFGLSNSAGVYHIGDGLAESSYSDIWQNGFNFRGNATAGSGILIVDPFFIQPSQENYKLRIGSSEYSPCLDTGNPDFIYNDGTLITSTNYRNDMGAYGGPDNIGWNP